MNNPTLSGFCVKKVFYYLIIQTKLFAKFTSDKKDDFGLPYLKHSVMKKGWYLYFLNVKKMWFLGNLIWNYY